jgi:hypothetical protein
MEYTLVFAALLRPRVGLQECAAGLAPVVVGSVAVRA